MRFCSMKRQDSIGNLENEIRLSRQVGAHSDSLTRRRQFAAQDFRSAPFVPRGHLHLKSSGT
jgi:hypothetical protein